VAGIRRRTNEPVTCVPTEVTPGYVSWPRGDIGILSAVDEHTQREAAVLVELHRREFVVAGEPAPLDTVDWVARPVLPDGVKLDPAPACGNIG